MKYQEEIDKNLSNNANGHNNPVLILKSKCNKGIYSKSDTKRILYNQEKENFINSKKDEILPFTERNFDAMRTLLRELKNIKIALINSSDDIERVFKVPLSHLKINVYFHL